MGGIQETWKILRRSGWHPGRWSDCSASIQLLMHKGFEVTPAIMRFLHEFEGIKFQVEHRFEPGEIIEHHVIPSLAMGALRYEHFKIFEKRFQEKMIPVGELFNRHLYLFVSETGKVYCEFGLLGGDMFQAIHHLMRGELQKDLSDRCQQDVDLQQRGNLCFVTDKDMPEWIHEVFKNDPGLGLFPGGSDGLLDFNPWFFPRRLFDQSLKYQNYYKMGITDAGIDRLLKEHVGLLRDDEQALIRGEMMKLRKRVLEVKREAERRDAKAFDKSASFTFWPVEHCAPIWAARNAILLGLKFERIAIALIRGSDHSTLSLCSNCKKIFSENLVDEKILSDA